MSELISTQRKEALRKILSRLHAGEEFQDLLRDVTPHSRSPRSKRSSSRKGSRGRS